MFGWRRKRDGFEWHKYVRTTIKLRRNDRKRRVDEFKRQAARKAHEAGSAGAKAGHAGARWLFERIAQAGRTGWRGLAKLPGLTYIGLGSLGRGCARILGAAGRHVLVGTRVCLRGLGRAVAWTARQLQRPGVAPMLAGAAIAAAVFGIARAILVSPTDAQTLTASAFATILGALALIGMRGLPQFSSPRLNLPRFSVGGRRRPIADMFGRLPGSSVRTAGFAAVGVAAVTAIAYFGGGMVWNATPNIGSLASFRLIGTEPREKVNGRARAVSGDTLSVAGRLIRLEGIEAPELAQTCRNSRGRSWRCGRAAQRRLAIMTGRKRVSCEIAETGTPRLYGGRCTISDTDIAESLVKTGYVFARSGVLGSTYGTAEAEARSAKLGVWRGANERPAAFREKRWAKAKQAAPSGCPIKGRIVRRAKVYVLPWSPGYVRARVSTRRGERWFCSENEAIAAGWRPGTAG